MPTRPSPKTSAPADPADPTGPVRLLLADDHPVVRAGLVAIIEHDGRMRVVGQADDGRQALRLWKELRPDVALVDLQMPLLDGTGVITAVRREFPEARLIVLTTFGGDEDVHRAVRAGAKGYLLKDTPREVLVECIETVHAGGTYFPAAIVGKLTGRMQAPDLSRREIDVLRLMAEGRSNKEIGTALFVAESTIKTHVTSLLLKLDAISRTEAVATALRRGFIKM